MNRFEWMHGGVLVAERLVERTAVLLPDVRNVGAARRLVREVAAATRGAGWEEVAILGVSELVTNAIVHAGTDVTVSVYASSEFVRVEVGDAGSQFPARRDFADVANTGRGLKLVEDIVDSWGCVTAEIGKAVWFEVGDAPVGAPAWPHDVAPTSQQRVTATMHRRLPSGATDTHAVTLRHVPLLMHLAWQEHAAELLRDYLLATVEEDPSVLEQHAHASEALGLLADQIPAPELPDDPDALLSQVTEEQVTADVVTVAVPATLAPRVSTLDALLTAATARAHAGEMLSPPTQPEIAEMRAWLCGQISGQIDGTVNPEPWCARADVQRAAAPGGPSQSYRHLTGAGRPLLVADEDGVIVAASPAALTLLGYGRAEELVGRRVIAVVPARYHQAHIAGTTLHAITGRDHLLGVPLIVSMVRADGTEIPVALEVRPQRLDGGHCIFVARFDAA